MTHRERLESKMERREEWAEKARARAAARFGAANGIADGIPFGQPILVGHHSEGRARRDQERIHSGMSKGIEETKLADHHESAATGIVRQLDRSIFSDDENAIAALEARAAASDATAAKINELNRAWRKGGIEAFAALTSPAVAQRAAETMKLAPWLKTPLDATSERASARRDRERIGQIKKRQGGQS